MCSRLIEDETTARYANQWLRFGGGAAGWPVGRMLSRREGAARVQHLLDGLAASNSAPR